jgi:nitrite reductase (NADH) large subunit
MTSPRPTVVVAGHGMVGHRLVEALVARGLTTSTDVVVVSEEGRPAYDRVALSAVFDGRTPEDLCLVPDGFYDAPGLRLVLGDAVAHVDRGRREVTTASGQVLDYDELVLATGSYPFVPPVPGRDAPGCFVYRTLEDLDALRAAAQHARVGLVVGGGLLGLEAAGALRNLGLETHVVEAAPRLLPLQVDEAGGAALRRQVEALGVVVHTGAMTQEVVAGADGRVTGVALADGNCIATDVVVFSAGVRPRDQLARDCGLEVGPRGGVLVNTTLRTGDPHVWAVGECAVVDGRVYGLVAPGYAMAEVLADRLCGGSATFPGADMSTKLKLLGVDVASFGDAFATTPGALELFYGDPLAGVYKKLVVSDDAQRLLGGILVGDVSDYATLRPMAGSDTPLPANPEDLILPARSGTRPPVGVASLPDDAQICSCNDVSKGVIRGAVREGGCTDVGAVKACTKAGATCGSCIPLVKQLVDAELTAAGVVVSKALCEHFDHSRQELFDLVRLQGLRTFTELVAQHGRGRGCAICKPVVASILASLGGGHVLAGEQAALQDTNDHFLANLQKDGTYSVVPRLPGGEVTPAQLLVIAEVARDFALYTKITGGQRIDLFGARVEQLPAIWRRLVDAGLESGHAYGKSLRTVKSCVGQAWCRYGVQDSTGLAVELELRYRGLRAPHKLKSAVSGCARECAEARGKDFGVIATEKGWNLYLGGNGGASPRHAVLFASDLDRETLLRYVDRYLMFYIRTADRLQRTAHWQESLDGGLDYLRSVIVDDVLGICAELDEAITRHVASYSDEWRDVLDDPEALARFVSFVNAPDAPDDERAYVVERGQRRPALPSERSERPTAEPTLVAGPTLQVVRA